MFLNDIEIIEAVHNHDMIKPFVGRQEGRISYGLSSFGYDIRLGNRITSYSNKAALAEIDPLNIERAYPVDLEVQDFHTIPPHGFILAHSLEEVKVPLDVLVICLGKSTYARCGLIVNVTPLEPGWRGQITLEISNTTNLPARVYVGEGICQLLFARGQMPATSYAARKGRYMDQRGVVLPSGRDR